MNFYPGFASKEERYEFFCRISTLLRHLLPPPLNEFTDKTKPTNCWMKLTYPGKLPGASYELHITPISKEHERIFGKGEKVVLVFYFNKGMEKVGDRVSASKHYSKQIDDSFGDHVLIELWGDNRDWVMLGIRLDTDELGTDADRYAPIVSRFIKSTIQPIMKVYQEVG